MATLDKIFDDQAQGDACCDDDDEVCNGCLANCNLFGNDDCSHCCSGTAKKEPSMSQRDACCDDDDEVCNGCLANCNLFGNDDCSHCCSE